MFLLFACAFFLLLAAGKQQQKGSQLALVMLDRLKAYRKEIYRAAHPESLPGVSPGNSAGCWETQ